jgi:hypothetical protein
MLFLISRGFWMSTSRSSGVYPDHEADVTTRESLDKPRTEANGHTIIPK